jgi:ornithine decarboxylase
MSIAEAFAARRERVAVRQLQSRRRKEASALLASDDARAALALHGTPLLLLEPVRVRSQYRRLRAALPFVRFHYAVKALSHDAVVSALADEGCGFDIASAEELALLQRHGVAAARIIHTHPVKKPSEIDAAIAAGIRLFVIDSLDELGKFAGRDSRVLVRLAYRSPAAKSDLSSKFGVGGFEAEQLVAAARAQGTDVAGFSFHVGSQLDDPQRFREAILDTLALMDRLEAELGVRFDTLDIGGGFPVAYDTEVTPLEDLATSLRPVLEPRVASLDIIAEPGRVLVAEAMTVVTSVVGRTERADGRWYHLDDGVYGAYSNVVAEDVHPFVFAVDDLAGRRRDAATHRWATLAGPTCDSADVIARDVLLPDLQPGDLLVSPVMGAYTAVTATRFNGRPLTPIAVVGEAPETASIEPIPSADSRMATAR